MEDNNTLIETLCFNNQIEQFQPNIDYNVFMIPKILEIKSNNNNNIFDINKIKNVNINIILNNFIIMSIPLEFFINFYNYELNNSNLIIPLNFEMFLPEVIFNFKVNKVNFEISNFDDLVDYSVIMKIALIKTDKKIQHDVIYQYIQTKSIDNINVMNVNTNANFNLLIKGFFIKCNVDELTNFKLLFNNHHCRFDYDEILLNTICKKITNTLLYVPFNINIKINDCNKNSFYSALYGSRIDNMKFMLKFNNIQDSITIFALSANYIKSHNDVLSMIYSL
jgi:hypothetical protein